MFFAVRLERGGLSMLAGKSIEPWSILLDGRCA
jgi:hypothetical protein